MDFPRGLVWDQIVTFHFFCVKSRKTKTNSDHFLLFSKTSLIERNCFPYSDFLLNILYLEPLLPTKIVQFYEVSFFFVKPYFK
ncbi:hypothetical protein NQ315_010018 [Exocentrus adspersus]|uniref:Uncharacterized protein n=1 Tax=Exocentrus adspersus TaxID=1586481 RepID=A0AAV8VK62_9CUCU|nr:hypothetical protein NQ315_010018 [Exocentrus adspersus]